MTQRKIRKKASPAKRRPKTKTVVGARKKMAGVKSKRPKVVRARKKSTSLTAKAA